MPKYTWDFEINGTESNRYEELYGLKFNPFPQHGKSELVNADLAMQSLAEANMTPEEIQKRLEPYFNQVFIDGVLKRWKLGEVVRCRVTCQW